MSCGRRFKTHSELPSFISLITERSSYEGGSKWENVWLMGILEKLVIVETKKLDPTQSRCIVQEDEFFVVKSTLRVVKDDG